MVVSAMYKPFNDIPLRIQPASIDSLEPTYTCKSASTLYSRYGVGGTNPKWTAHLTASKPLYKLLDEISGVSPNSSGFHQSCKFSFAFRVTKCMANIHTGDHYFDNLSSRSCHQKRFPCKIGNSTDCVTEAIANEVFRLGEYEYSYIYRDAPQSLQASVASCESDP